MQKYQGVYTDPSVADQNCDYDKDLAQRLLGDPVEERLIINAELGIFPMDDD